MLLRVKPVDKDKETYIVDTNVADTIAYEETARRRKWGSIQDNPATATAFLAWRAAARQGFDPGIFEDFCDAVASIEPEDDTEKKSTPTEIGPSSLQAFPSQQE